MREFGGVLFRSTEDILRHPQFPMARMGYIEAVLALYEANPALIELMRDAGRIMTFGIVMCLWGAYRADARDTWPTVNRLKAMLAQFDVASDRQIDKIIARLASFGFVNLVSPEEDGRVRLVLPTERMISHDRAWLYAHYVPLGVMFGHEAFALPLSHDAAFQREVRAANIAVLPHIAENVMRQNKPMMRLLTRAVGILALMKLVQVIARRSMTSPSYSLVGSRLGVSRTHVRDMLRSAERHGDVVFEGKGSFRLMPSLLTAFDRLVADGMCVSEYSHAVAMQALGGQPQALPLMAEIE